MTDHKTRTDPASALGLAQAVAELAALLPGAGNGQRTALHEIVEAVSTWVQGQADEAAVRTQVAETAERAFTAGVDMNLPECWMLGLVGSVLGCCTAVDVVEGSDDLEEIARSELASTLAAQLLAQSVDIARRRPDALPLGVTPKLYRVVADDVARRIEAAGRAAIGQAFSARGSLQ